MLLTRHKKTLAGEPPVEHCLIAFLGSAPGLDPVLSRVFGEADLQAGGVLLVADLVGEFGGVFGVLGDALGEGGFEGLFGFGGAEAFGGDRLVGDDDQFVFGDAGKAAVDEEVAAAAVGLAGVGEVDAELAEAELCDERSSVELHAQQAVVGGERGVYGVFVEELLGRGDDAAAEGLFGHGGKPPLDWFDRLLGRTS